MVNYFKTTIQGVCLLVTVLVVSCESPVKYNRPKDNWAFRSVLDGKPRMLNLALDTSLYVSYDLELAKIYKVWKGGIRLDGAVYTTAHGVQPTSFGHTYYEDKTNINQWRLSNNGVVEKTDINYIGYSFEKGQIAIEYELISRSGEKVRIKETPEYMPEKEFTVLFRKFHLVTKPGNYTPVLSFSIDENQVATIKSDGGSFEKTGTSGTLALSDKVTSIKTFYKRPVAGQEQEIVSIPSQAERGLVFLKSNDCSTCHLNNENMVGPSYVDIAKRYPFKTSTVKKLAQRIINGGSGSWGDIMMTPHKNISVRRAENIAYYILSLDGEPEPQKELSGLFLGIESVEFLLDDKKRNAVEDKATRKGVAVNYYMLDNLETLYGELTRETLPTFNGVAPVIHLAGNDTTFKKGSRQFYAEFKGYIESKEYQTKYFRLVSKDGSKLKLNGRLVIDNGGIHWHQAEDAAVKLKKGSNEFTVQHFAKGTNYAISLQWSDDGKNFTLVPGSVLSHSPVHFEKILPYVPKEKLARNIRGDTQPLDSVHPSFDLANAIPPDFHPRIGGIDFISENEMVICTWDSVGAVYILKNFGSQDPESIEVRQIAKGLAEPLGIKVVDGELYVLQKQELTKLIDHNGDEIIDEYRKVANSWHATDHYHEFAFGLVYKNGSFYATLATDLGKEYRNVKDRGRVMRISKDGDEVEFIAKGFRTPNGIAEGPDGALYVADNQGNWIPTSKIVRVEKGKFYGFKFADYEEVKDLKEAPPLVWMPHVEISNSPSQPAILNLGPYKDQMIHGDVTHGGIKRVFIDEVDGVKQGAVFRFSQGLDAGINRLMWGPDGSLYAGGIGSGGNWRQEGKLWYALHRLTYNKTSTFEMLTVRARSDGMEIEMTEPISKIARLSSEDFIVQQYYYQATEKYGGPKRGEEDLNILSVNISGDRKRIFLELDGVKEGHVIYIRIKNPFVSENERSLWSTEAWYTMTKKPDSDPGFRQTRKSMANNTLSKAEIARGWELLFDGKSKFGWHNYLGKGDPGKWIVTGDGELHLAGKGGGNIVTDEEFENFELSLEWKIAKGGNSGLMFNVVEDEKYKAPWQTGPEVQILDNLRHPDARYEKHRAGDLYDMIACRMVTANEGDEWNRLRLKIKDGHAEHWQNGYKVVEYGISGEGWDNLIANSKFKKMKDFGKAKKGRLCIQDHGDKLWLRNIKIRRL